MVQYGEFGRLCFDCIEIKALEEIIVIPNENAIDGWKKDQPPKEKLPPTSIGGYSALVEMENTHLDKSKFALPRGPEQRRRA
uniref:Uncharacterized protein n=1 Tax=Oryza glumipatula TaxID=40148 RepID=A0A0E0BG21_9ORYZ